MKNIGISFLLAASVVFFNGCATNPVTGKKQVVLMSESQELAMGKEADPQIVAQFGLYEDAKLQNFIKQKGQQMAAISHRNNIPYEFKIVDSDVINAFAVPGGYVYFTRGIMAHFNNEAEFAGVLGHEIGHIAARHTVEQQRNALFSQLGLIAGIVIAPELAQFAEAASQGLGLMMLKFGRDAERESDKLGVEYSTKIGYDAKQMAYFFNTLERQGAKSGSDPLPNILSTHPNPGERLQTVQQLAVDWQRQLNLTNPQIGRNSYLQMIEGLVYGEDPKGGYLENNVFYHPEMKFQFNTPAGWAYQNSPQQVQLASKDGKAMMMLMLGKGASLQEAASSFLQQYKMQAQESREVNVNGLRALAVVADLQQQQGVLRTLSYFIQQGNTIYHMMGLSAAADFNAYAPYFSNTMQSFKELTDPSKLNKKPERVRIKTVSQNMTLDQALRNFRMPAARLEELSILNGMKLTDNVPAGTMIKIIGE